MLPQLVHQVWGEGASDLWGHLEEEDAGGENDFLKAVRRRIRRDLKPVDEEPENSELAAA